MMKLLIVLVMCLGVLNANSQDLLANNGTTDNQTMLTVDGTVFEMVGDEITALPFANVFVEGTTDITTADFDGNFSLSTKVVNGKLKFTFKGYETVVKTLDGDSKSFKIILKKEDVTLVDNLNQQKI